MQVGEAIKLAKDWVRDIFADEQITNLGLEEVKYVELRGEWQVTLGFSRPWDNRSAAMSAIGVSAGRSLKIVTIDDFLGQVKGVENRELTT